MRATLFFSIFFALVSIAFAAPTKFETRSGKNGRVTYYSGYMMDEPACGGSAPNDDDLVAAVRSDSPFKCGDSVTLMRGGNKATVKIVDHCDSCTYGEWFDLSKSAFKKLGELELGVMNDIIYWKND
ncbi:hypothetical protein MYAM1_001043 [Malassezia yamatoensis]|uniref:RlpA-like protein double-psi beta-barrel domain-containing protein n=1 Tax=Malassezia yamatoensis TaxID=253288 RepID=A0AAJ5YVC7_9BASI|nr:hypothetical protein MYAM1_001043 [Malassezia yamatoensis]